MKTLKRDSLIGLAATLPAHAANDLPAIRQTINDTADQYRKDGWKVRDFAQDRMVADVQRVMRREARRNAQ